MTTTNMHENDYIDILFEGRNKRYGSYDLRRNYNTRIRNGSAAVLGLAIVFSFASALADYLKPKEKTERVVITDTIVDLQPPPMTKDEPLPPPPKKLQPPPPAAPAHIFIPPTIAPDDAVPKDAAPNPPDDDHIAGPANNDGLGDPNSITPPDIDGPTGTGTGPVDLPAEKTKLPEYIEQMPEFNGNLKSYLSNNLNYPSDARERGKEGRVVIRFVVNESGSISDAMIAQGTGTASLDREALRVVMAMPTWKPGRQQGKLTAVWYTLPITFTLD